MFGSSHLRIPVRGHFLIVYKSTKYGFRLPEVHEILKDFFIMRSQSWIYQMYSRSSVNYRPPIFFGASVAGPSGVTYALVNPPSTTKSAAFTKLLSSLLRKITA